MNITFYDCTADHRVVNKAPYMRPLLTVNSMEVTYNMDIINPVFTLEYNSNFPLHCNYCYCAELNRYYFILTMTQDPGSILTIRCQEDIRMSHIRPNDFSMVVTRNEYIRKSNIPDKSLPINADFHIPIIIPFDNSLFQERPDTLFHANQPLYFDIVETI